jgi:hypothetical protein
MQCMIAWRLPRKASQPDQAWPGNEAQLDRFCLVCPYRRTSWTQEAHKQFMQIFRCPLLPNFMVFGLQLFKETIKTLKLLKEQEDAIRNRPDSDASDKGTDEALDGSASDVNGMFSRGSIMNGVCIPTMHGTRSAQLPSWCLLMLQ